MSDINNLISNYKRVRQKTVNIANMFDQEDQLDQSMKNASPILITSLQVKCFQEIEETVILHYH